MLKLGDYISLGKVFNGGFEVWRVLEVGGACGRSVLRFKKKFFELFVNLHILKTVLNEN